MHADPEPRAWAPLANPVFRALAIAQFVSNVGTWMQTVGAQWEMGSLGADPLLIALIVRYRVPDAAQADFRATMRLVGRARRRSGAERWGLFRDGDDPDVFLETFIVPTWAEHLRQLSPAAPKFIYFKHEEQGKGPEFANELKSNLGL